MSSSSVYEWRNSSVADTALRLEHILARSGAAARLHAAQNTFHSVQPFPHVVLDGLFPESLLDLADAEFPDPETPMGTPSACKNAAKRRGRQWHCTAHGTGNGGHLKLGTGEEASMGRTLQALMRTFKSKSFVRHLEVLTGIGPLIVDDTNLGAGLHQIFSNGSLQIHADFNRHPDNHPQFGVIERRVNLFLYLNDKWRPSWGGHLQLWDRSLKACGQRIAPKRNRLVVFASTDYSFHGHAEPLACPPHRSRRSIAIYYYTSGKRPEGEVNVTARLRTPRGTLYRQPAGRCSEL